MPSPGNFQNEVERLNKEVQALKDALLVEQTKTENYKSSLTRAQSAFAGQPVARDINPIIKQLRHKNLSLREKTQIMYPEVYPSDPEDIYYQWVAPSRLVIKRDKQWYWTVALIIMIITTIAILSQAYMCIAVVLAFGFAIYINSSTPAKDIIYRLTKQGVEIGDGEGLEIYTWGQMLEYAYYYKNNTEVLYLETILSVPQRIMILFSSEDRKNINMILEANLPYKPPPKKQNIFSKYFDGIYIPLQDFRAVQEKIDNYYDQKYAAIIAELQKEGRLPKDMSVSDLRKAENIKTLKLIDDLQKQQEEEIKKMLGL